ncbi:hypothetical protein THRCLA_05811 [Thraustotheca clavata]|uniref:Palmitoyltransferase DHHC domain-containing protein n=1 Tax=Thraustotheca clavata TaxID=74557 RepID=A0A1V9ZSC6_9STRA|nr:hypothetical protein THRCLA_05811 [Thraustotheca clavata]
MRCPLLVALGLVLTLFIIHAFMFGMLPLVYAHNGLFLTTIYGFYGTFVFVHLLVNYIQCIRTNPGEASSISTIYEEDIICDYCNAPQPPRCLHCHSCQTCILEMDHHCVWMNNCIGYYNYRFYWLYLLYGWNSCGLVAFIADSTMQHIVRDLTFYEKLYLQFPFVLCLGLSLAFFSLWVVHLYLIVAGQTTLDLLREPLRKPLTLTCMQRNVQQVFGIPWWKSILIPSITPRVDKRKNNRITYRELLSRSPNRSNSIAMNSIAKSSKEVRAQEALAMKDEQLRILTEQNTQLLNTLNSMDDELQALKMSKLQIEEENRSLRDSNFEVQSRARAADAHLKKAENSMEEKEMQIKVLTDHNGELLRLLEIEEGQSGILAKENAAIKQDADALASKYASLQTTAKTHEEIAGRAVRDSQLRAEEVRLLRIDTDQLRTSNNELKMKAQVELESLHEQLRVRKEKQYQLLEKIQSLEEAKRQSDDTLHGMEERVRQLLETAQERDTQLQLESKVKRSQMDANKHLQVENDQLNSDKQTLQSRLEKAEQERTRMEAENRDSADQLREMAEKVFQLLERLKLSELGKTKSLEALKQKEMEMLSLKKKNARLLKDVTQEGKNRVKMELDKNVLLEQLQALKKHNSQLSARCRDEVKAKLKETEERTQLAEKLKTMSSRLSFLLNKMQADEEAKLCTKEEMKKMQAQIQSLMDKNSELTQKLNVTGDSNRIVTEALRCKQVNRNCIACLILEQEELDTLVIKFEALSNKMINQTLEQSNDEPNQVVANNTEMPPEDKEYEASGRFFVECRASHGGLLVIKPKRSTNGCQEYLDKLGINSFLKWAQKQSNIKQRLVEKIAVMVHQLMTSEEATLSVQETLASKQDHLDHVGKKAQWLQERLNVEEEAKRKTLIRYVHEIKSRQAVAADNSSIKQALKLPESGIGDEEVHAIAALLRTNSTIHELQLQSNSITSEGARAIAAILSSSSCVLSQIDLRKNRIGEDGIRVLSEALGRNPRIKHVYVHAGGKIEALGASNGADPGLIQVETVCIIDVRENDTGRASLELEFTEDVMDTTASVVPLSSSDKLFAKRTTLELANAAALEKKREWQKLQKRKRVAAQEKEKAKQKELMWSGRAGGLDIIHSKKQLPPLEEPKQTMERSLSAPSVKDEPQPSKEGMTSLGEDDLKVQKKHQHTTAFSRRLKESPLAKPTN